MPSLSSLSSPATPGNGAQRRRRSADVLAQRYSAAVRLCDGFMQPVLALAILAMTFAGEGAWDVLSAQSGKLPGWYGMIRMKLTFMTVGALLVAMIRVG